MGVFLSREKGDPYIQAQVTLHPGQPRSSSSFAPEKLQKAQELDTSSASADALAEQN